MKSQSTTKVYFADDAPSLNNGIELLRQSFMNKKQPKLKTSDLTADFAAILQAKDEELERLLEDLRHVKTSVCANATEILALREQISRLQHKTKELGRIVNLEQVEPRDLHRMLDEVSLASLDTSAVKDIIIKFSTVGSKALLHSAKEQRARRRIAETSETENRG